MRSGPPIEVSITVKEEDYAIPEPFKTIIGKIDEIAVVSKMGTEHENHIGWRFPEGKSANLYCSCGGLLVGKE